MTPKIDDNSGAAPKTMLTPRQTMPFQFVQKGRTKMKAISIGGLMAVVVLSISASAQEPWPKEIAGHVALQPGEHPRLFFRRSDLAELRQRAETPEGQAILKRLREVLNGGDGGSMPENLGVQGQVNQDGSGEFAKDPAGRTYTISHVAGYGFLYQITGEKKYADLGREAMDAALAGFRGRDRRYSFKFPYGALRGPRWDGMPSATTCATTVGTKRTGRRSPR